MILKGILGHPWSKHDSSWLFWQLVVPVDIQLEGSIHDALLSQFSRFSHVWAAGARACCRQNIIQQLVYSKKMSVACFDLHLQIERFHQSRSRRHRGGCFVIPVQSSFWWSMMWTKHHSSSLFWIFSASCVELEASWMLCDPSSVMSSHLW